MTVTKELQEFAQELQGYAADCDIYGPPAPGMIIEFVRKLLLIAITAVHDVAEMDREIAKKLEERS